MASWRAPSGWRLATRQAAATAAGTATDVVEVDAAGAAVKWSVNYPFYHDPCFRCRSAV